METNNKMNESEAFAMTKGQNAITIGVVGLAAIGLAAIGGLAYKGGKAIVAKVRNAKTKRENKTDEKTTFLCDFSDEEDPENE